MPAAKKKHQHNKFPFFTLIGILFLVLFAFLIYRVMQPVAVVAPIEAPVTEHSPDSIDGIYKGNLPCADCPGITETLIIAKDGSYIMEDVYQEKSTQPFQTEGKWEIVNSDILKLTPNLKNNSPTFFQILDNGNFQMLDSNMQKIDSPFNQTLTKQN